MLTILTILSQLKVEELKHPVTCQKDLLKASKMSESYTRKSFHAVINMAARQSEACEDLISVHTVRLSNRIVFCSFFYNTYYLCSIELTSNPPEKCQRGDMCMTVITKLETLETGS
jgi:hypothetical protein